MPRRVIYIKNPTRGSHFRTIGDGGDGGKTGGAAGYVIGLGPNLMDPIIEWMLSGGNHPKKKKKLGKGKGIPYTPGIFIGTGGARYKTAPSNWFKAPLKPNVTVPYGLSDMIEHLAALYEQQFSTDFLEWGDIMPPLGTPGTLLPLAGTVLKGPTNTENQLYPNDPFVYGATWENPFPGRPGQYYAPGKDPNKKRGNYFFIPPGHPTSLASQLFGFEEQTLSFDFSQAGIVPKGGAGEAFFNAASAYLNNIINNPAVHRAASTILFGPFGTARKENFWRRLLGF